MKTMKTSSHILQILKSGKGSGIRKLGLSFFLMIFLYVSGMAQTANIIVQPSSTTTTLGATFNVAVRVDFTGAASADVVEIHLAFDKAKLKVTGITKPSSSLLPTEAIPLEPINTINANGKINYNAGTSSNFPNTDFDILNIGFEVIGGTGTTTPLTFLTSFPDKTDVIRNFSSILGSAINGSVTINSCATPPTATLSTSNGASICNGQPIKLYLSNATGAGPFDLVINGTTYTDVPVNGTTEFATIPFPTYKVWPANPTPVTPQNNDGLPIEVGTKIRSSVSGYIRGIRFYNGFNSPGGTYTGKLWNGTSLVGTADFATVSGVGWKEVLFPAPVQIAANTTYIASVYSSAGNYAVTDGYFNNAATNGPLTAPKDGDFGPNGVYNFGGPGVPTSDYMQSNYWVDVIFSPNSNTFSLTGVTDVNGCGVTGALQTINILYVDCSSLPVTIVNLSASPGNRKVTVRWTTSQELNNRGFDVERSDDGSTWTKIGFVAGAGTSNAPINYSYLDQNLELRKYYYRLKQIDIDSRTRYSAVVSATLDGKGDFVLGQNYPNPFNGQTTIQFSLPKASQVNITLFDMSGRSVKTLVNGAKEAGTHAINVTTGSLPKGVYYYKMQAGDFTDVKKLTVQ
jgi:hypothetical protein